VLLLLFSALRDDLADAQLRRPVIVSSLVVFFKHPSVVERHASFLLFLRRRHAINKALEILPSHLREQCVECLSESHDYWRS